MGNYIVAIDLGSSWIKGAVAQKNENGELKILAVEKELSTGLRLGVVYNHSEAASKVKNIILKLQNRLRIEIGKVYIGLAGHTLKSIPSVIPFAFNKEVEISEDFLKQLYDRNFDLTTDEISVYEVIEQAFFTDGEIEPNPIGCLVKEGEAHYSVIVGKPQIKERICNTIERVPLEITGLFTSPITTAEVLLSQEDKELGCAMIDFGGETTSVTVYTDNFLRHVAVIPFGGKVVTKDITDLKVTLANAEKLKIEHGCALVTMENPNKKITITQSINQTEKLEIAGTNLAQIIEARMDEITNFICIQLEKSGYYNKLRNGLVITGGASQLKGIQELLALKTGMDVRIGSYLHLLDKDTDENYITPENAHLVGLLYFGTDDCSTSTPKKLEKVKATNPNKRNFFSKVGDKLGQTLFNERE